MNRREFLKYQAKGILWMIAGGPGILLPKKLMAAPFQDIVVVKGAPAAATRAAVDLLGRMKQFVKPGDRVVIKPNMSVPTPPERASTTHPEVVRELAVMCKEAGAERVLVLDHTLAREELCLEALGIRKACNPIGKKIVFALSDDRFFKATDIPEGKSVTSTDIMKEVLKSDVLIAAPVAKSHSAIGVSLSMKGMMGLNYDRRVMHGKYDLHTREEKCAGCGYCEHFFPVQNQSAGVKVLHPGLRIMNPAVIDRDSRSSSIWAGS